MGLKGEIMEELLNELQNNKELNIYSAGINRVSDNRYCIIKNDSVWQVFYYERGTKRNLKEFTDEKEACNYFKNLVLEQNERNKDKIKQVIEEYKKQTQKDCYKINCVDGVVNILDDKIGGYPYLPTGIEYPKDKNGEYMPLLIQINLKNIDLEGYPKKGILEIFANKDFDYPTDYVIKYFEEGLDYQTEFPEIDLSNFVLSESIKIELEKDITYMPLSDYRSKQELHKAVQKVYGGGLVIDCDYYFKNYVSCYDNWYDEATNSLNIPTANIGGYADFTQQDPRFGEKETRTECLLKIDSYLDDRIFIGDSGIIFTLISPEDIKNCKFENATFDWDCY